MNFHFWRRTISLGVTISVVSLFLIQSPLVQAANVDFFLNSSDPHDQFLTIFFQEVFQPLQTHQTDINNDGIVDIADYSLFLVALRANTNNGTHQSPSSASNFPAIENPITSEMLKLSVAPSPLNRGRMPWGTMLDLDTDYNGPDQVSRRDQLRILQDLRIDLLRIPINELIFTDWRFRNYEPPYPCTDGVINCNWEPFGEIVALTRNLGAEPIVTINGFPLPEQTNLGTDNWDSYADYVENLAKVANVDRAFGEPITYWEIWNEPPLGSEEADEVANNITNIDQFITILKLLRSAIIAGSTDVDGNRPELVIMNGGLWHFDMTALQKIATEIPDITLNFHDYNRVPLSEQDLLTGADRQTWLNTNEAIGPDHRFEDLPKQFIADLRSAGLQNQLVLTEFNTYPYNILEEIGCTGTDTSYHRSFGLYQLGALINSVEGDLGLAVQYLARNPSDNIAGQCFGLLSEDFQPLPAFKLLKAFGKANNDVVAYYQLQQSQDQRDVEGLGFEQPDGSVQFILINYNLSSAQEFVLALPANFTFEKNGSSVLTQTSSNLRINPKNALEYVVSLPAGDAVVLEAIPNQ